MTLLLLGITITRTINNNPHLKFVKGTVLRDKEQKVGITIRDKG